MRKTNAPSQPFGRLIAACGILLAVVLVSALMTTFLQKPDLDALADNAATAAPILSRCALALPSAAPKSPACNPPRAALPTCALIKSCSSTFLTAPSQR